MFTRFVYRYALRFWGWVEVVGFTGVGVLGIGGRLVCVLFRIVEVS